MKWVKLILGFLLGYAVIYACVQTIQSDPEFALWIILLTLAFGAIPVYLIYSAFKNWDNN